MPMPLEIIGLHRPTLELLWEDGHRGVYSARDLRLACRCAYCIEELTGAPLLDEKRVPAEITIRHLELVGQYALGVHFSDHHTTGIYPFRGLRESCPCEACCLARAGAP